MCGWGAVCTENLGVKLSHKWQAARTEKLADLMDKAAQKNAAYVALFGQMFGQERVSESVIDSLFSAANEDKHIQMLAFLITIMDIDEEAFENDISLRSEFVRLALQDDSLSESERNRLISCGWNALNGKGVSAE